MSHINSADSTYRLSGQCRHVIVHQSLWCFKAQCLAWTLVELSDNCRNLLAYDFFEIHALRPVLAQQAIRILVKPLSPEW